MELQWSHITIGEWKSLLEKIPHSNWMQSWPYAKATHSRDHKNIRFARIQEQSETLGFVVMQEIKLGPIHFIEIHRGPLWFAEHSTEENFRKFAELLRKTFPSRPLRRFRWLPEIENTEKTQNILKQAGFSPMPQSFETLLLDITSSEQELRAGLEQKWRNGLNKAEKSELQLRMDLHGNQLDLFLLMYERHKFEKGFLGVSSPFLRTEAKTAMEGKEALFAWAFHHKQPVAGMMFLLHGKSASYRVGWNTEEGRSANAHYLLLWKSILNLKRLGIQSLDLGGIKNQEAPGVSHFKQGLGAESLQLPGLFR
jgi:lipid II:glycine glycyltransferase (peptidoglycan interpeptide bridge formation enzyme)